MTGAQYSLPYFIMFTFSSFPEKLYSILREDRMGITANRHRSKTPRPCQEKQIDKKLWEVKQLIQTRTHILNSTLIIQLSHVIHSFIIYSFTH